MHLRQVHVLVMRERAFATIPVFAPRHVDSSTSTPPTRAMQATQATQAMLLTNPIMLMRAIHRIQVRPSAAAKSNSSAVTHHAFHSPSFVMDCRTATTARMSWTAVAEQVALSSRTRSSRITPSTQPVPSRSVKVRVVLYQPATKI